jgi:NTP pyrophosphatase (non-canonical NTP hydrolase)
MNSTDSSLPSPSQSLLGPTDPQTLSPFEEYQAWVKETARYPRGLTYPANQLASEAGEVLGGVNKGIRALHCLDVQWLAISPKLQAYIRDEAGDVLWSLAALCNEIGCTLEDLMRENRMKLEAREAAGTLYRTL